MFDNPPPAGIAVVATFSPAAAWLRAMKPRVHLDGGPPVERPWGDTFIPVGPGRHQVRCSAGGGVGDATIALDVPPGRVVQVKWRAPWLPVRAGVWTVVGVQPLAAVPV